MDINMGNHANYVLEGTSGSWLAQNRNQLRVNAEELVQEQENLEKNEAAESEKPKNLPVIVAELERISLAFNKKLEFKIDQKDHEISVKVIDIETDKVVRELPSVEIQRLRDRIRETLGILFDEQI
jgi:flagellar protein FlaG